MVGFSAVRWYCQGEIEIQIARKYPLVRPFLVTLNAEGCCPTLSPAALEVYDRDPLQLKLEFAAAMDIEIFIRTCYELEGDGLGEPHPMPPHPMPPHPMPPLPMPPHPMPPHPMPPHPTPFHATLASLPLRHSSPPRFCSS